MKLVKRLYQTAYWNFYRIYFLVVFLESNGIMCGLVFLQLTLVLDKLLYVTVFCLFSIETILVNVRFTKWMFCYFVCWRHFIDIPFCCKLIFRTITACMWMWICPSTLISLRIGPRSNTVLLSSSFIIIHHHHHRRRRRRRRRHHHFYYKLTNATHILCKLKYI